MDQSTSIIQKSKQGVQNGTITHLIIREGHIFDQKDVFIPETDIDSITEESLHLKLDNGNIEELFAIPVRHLQAWA